MTATVTEEAISSRSWFGIRIQDALLIVMFGALSSFLRTRISSRVYLASILPSCS